MKDLVPNITPAMETMAAQLGVTLLKKKVLEATRTNIENKQNTWVTNAEIQHRKEHTHYPKTLNQVEAKLLAQKKKRYVFNFNLVLNPPSGFTQSQILHRMQASMKLCRKYNVQVSIASFANNEFELRSPYDLQKFLEWLGMNSKDAKTAVHILEENKA